MSISLLLEMAASSNPDRTAVVSGEIRLTTSELSALADGGAGVIAASGAQHASYVGTGGVFLPLLLFSSAAQRIPLAVIGILQYITPTMQFLLAVFVYKEPFSAAQLVGFGLVWVALIVFSVEGFLARGTTQQPVPAAVEL